MAARITSYWSEIARLSAPIALIFEGGGIRGLVFLGHVITLLQKKDRSIAAFSGASAGSIIAAALWSGLTPEETVAFIKSRSKGRGGLAGSMFGFRDPVQYYSSIFILVLFLIVEALGGFLIKFVLLGS